MSDGIKIRMGTPNQAAIMDLLHRFADHKAVCDDCNVAFTYKRPELYCETGQVLLEELTAFDEVQPQ